MNIKYVVLISTFLSLNLEGMEGQPTYAVILDTDLQYPREDKKDHAPRIKSVIEKTITLQEAFVATGGDQIQGETKKCGCCGPCCCPFQCFFKEGAQQTSHFVSDFLKPLESILSTKVTGLDTGGNHEFYDPSKKMLKLIKKRHGNLYYTANLGPICVIVGAVYFDKKLRAWAQRIIEEKQKATREDTPFILINHYNPVGEHDDWYPRKDDNELAKILQGKNVIRLWGHNHSTYKTEWEGHPGYCGGGKEFIGLGFDAKGVKVSESAFVAPEQEENSCNTQAIPIPNWKPESAGNDTFKDKIERTYNMSVINQHCFDKNRFWPHCLPMCCK